MKDGKSNNNVIMNYLKKYSLIIIASVAYYETQSTIQKTIKIDHRIEIVVENREIRWRYTGIASMNGVNHL